MKPHCGSAEKMGGAPSLLAIAHSVVVLVSLALPAIAQAQVGGLATDGYGLYRDNIVWFSWGATGAPIANNASVTNTIPVAGQILRVTCQITNLFTSGTSGIQAFATDGRGLGALYRTPPRRGMDTGLANVNSGAFSQVSFRLACSATFGPTGTAADPPYRMDGLVFGDAEQNANVTEWEQATSSGPLAATSTWRIIDRYRPQGCTRSTQATLTGGTLRLTGDSAGFCNPPPGSPATEGQGPLAVAFLQGNTEMNVVMTANTRSAIALGVFVNVSDQGDAPASYGVAQHLPQFAWTGGTVAGVQPVNDPAFQLAAQNPAATVRLGVAADTELTLTGNPTATADDADGLDDEDALSGPVTLVGGVLNSIPCTGTGAAVRGFVDWNGDGDFTDAGENSAPATCGAGGTVNLTWNPPTMTAGSTYLRLRIANSAAEVATPTGVGASGEVEDYQVTVVPARLILTKTTQQIAGGPFGFTLTNTTQTTGVVTTTAAGTATQVDGDTSTTGTPDAFTINATGSSIVIDESSPPPGWVIDSAICTDVNGTTVGSLSGSGYTIPAAAVVQGAAFTCSFVDRPPTDLTISKSSTPNPYVPGGAFSYTIVVSNLGPASVTGASVTDPLPAALASFTWTCTPNSSSAACGTPMGTGPSVNTLVDLPVGGSVTILVTGTLPPGPGGVLTNTATVSPPPGVQDLVPGNNSATDINPVNAVADLRISKASTPNPYVPGSPLTYTVVVTNGGPSDAFGARVRDPLPAAFSGFTWTCAASAGAGCTTPSGTGDVDALVDLPVGSTATFTSTGTVPPSYATVATNTATIAPPPTVRDPVPGNNTASSQNPPGPLADLRITKTQSANPYTAGAPLTYTLLVENLGPSDATNARVQDVLPGSLTNAMWTCTASGAGAACGSAGGVNVIDALVTLPVGTSATFTITGTVDPGTTGVLSNTATVSAPIDVTDPNPGNNTSTVHSGAAPQADLMIVKNATPNPYAPGTPLTFTIVASNNGPSDAPNARVQDLFPASLSGFTWSCAPSAGAASCGAAIGMSLIDVLVDLPVGGAVTFTVTGTVPSDTTGVLTNTATITPPLDVTDPVPGNNSSTVNLSPNTIADLQVTKTAAPNPYVPGAPFTYTIVASNAGPSGAPGSRLQDSLPAALATFTWTCTGSSGGACGTTSGSGPVDLLVDLPVGGSVQVLVTGVMPAGQIGTLTNTATVSPPTGVTDSNPGNNISTVDTPGPPLADLAIVKTGPPIAVRGEPLTYALNVTNNGRSDAVGVTLHDPAPLDLIFVSASAPCTGGFPCTIGALAVGATASVTVTLQVPVDYGGPQPIVNTATVTATTADPVAGNNSSSVSTPLVEQADIQLTKSVDNRTPRGGETVTFTITAHNAGPSNATGVQVTDQIPIGLRFIGATPSQGTFDPPTGLWQIGALPNGATVTLAIAVQVLAPGNHVNVAIVTGSDQGDPDPSNNFAGTPIGAWDPADVRIAMMTSASVAAVGSAVTFTVTASNAGPDPATNVQVSDVLPDGLTLVSATASTGTYDTTTGVWTMPTLPIGGAETLTLATIVTRSGAITHIARRIGQVEADPVAENDTGGVTINGPSADVQVVKTIDHTATPIGNIVTFTITATNNGPGHATSVQIRDALPPGLTFAAATASQGLYVPDTSLWTIGTLDAPGTGGMSTATLQLRAIVTAAGALTNTATVASSDEPDPMPSNDTSAVGVTSGAGHLRAELFVNGDADRIGSPFDVIVRATNAGQVDVSGPVTMVVPFPAEVTFVSVDSGVSCETRGLVVSCMRPGVTLATGQYVEIRFRGTVTQPLPAGLAVFGSVFMPEDRSAQDAVAMTLIKAPAGRTADVQVTQAASAAPHPDDARRLTYTVAIANAGPGNATGVTLQDVLPAGLEAVSATASQGTCATSGTSASLLACDLGTLSHGQTATVTIVGTATAGQQIAHLVTASAREVDPDPTNNAALDVQTLTPTFAPDRDTDGDGMRDVWESTIGLNPGVADAANDADGDGVSNLDEYRLGTHPRGFYKQYFAEGVSNTFFGTMFSVVNPNTSRDAALTFELMHETGAITSTPMRLPAWQRYDGDADTMLSGWQGSFATLIESDRPIASDRLTWWDPRGHGTGLESGLSAASTHWLFAEGATHGGFQLFFLLQNPDMAQAADVIVRYLLPAGAPVVKTYTIAPHTRLTVFVNDIPELAATDVSADITSTRPIVAERAIYRSTATQVLAAGHVGAGATAASSDWFFAEGATGDFFNLYLLLGNPNVTDAAVTVQYLLPDGRTVVKPYSVAANTRRTIDVAGEDPRLAGTAVAMTVSSTQPLVAERAMWWPGPSVAPAWHESHVVLGATTTGTRWAVASGAAGGPMGEQTFVLVANHATMPGRLRVTAMLDDGTSHVRELPIGATSRLTIEIATLIPEAANHAFSVIVESLGATPVPIVVEGARYASPDGQFWGAGAAARGTKLDQ